jgi:ribosome-associated protein
MTTSDRDKKDTQKLQRAIVDGLEDVKAQDIQVFDTEHLSPLFERVIVASGTSNRQTKALASSVRDAVREAGFPKPRIEGEENGEWIIVDCGAAVAHIMQPAIRQYYHLEEIWGDKPVRLKFGAAKPVRPAPKRHAEGQEGRRRRRSRPCAAASAAKTAERAEKAEQEAKPPRNSAKPAQESPAGKAPAQDGGLWRRPPPRRFRSRSGAAVKKATAKKAARAQGRRSAAANEAARGRGGAAGARLGADRLGRLRQALPARDQARTARPSRPSRAARRRSTTLMAAERERIEGAIAQAACPHRGARRARHGAHHQGPGRASCKNWQLECDDVALVIGGPDGLDPAFRAAAHERIRLSDLTLPHAMVRVLLVEQLYRAWSVNANHPYHRE